MKFDAADILATDHADLDALLDHVMAGLTASRKEEAYQKLDLFWARLAMHIRAEHLHLFPAILSICQSHPLEDGLSAITTIITGLRADHDLLMHDLARLIKKARPTGTQSNWMPEAIEILKSARTLLEEHNRVEEAHIYPLAAHYLSEEEYEILLTSMRRELDNVPFRFRNDGR